MKLVYHLGYRRHHLHSTLTSHEARAAFAAHVHEGMRYGMFDAFSDWQGREFRGRVEADGFVVMRRLRSRNSFAPLIRLRFHDSQRGCAVDFTLHLEPLIAVFMLGWMSGLSLVCWFMLLSWY